MRVLFGIATALAMSLVGSAGNGGYLVATGQYVRPAGEVLAFFGRPSDLAIDPRHARMAVKNSHGLVLIDLLRWRIAQVLPMPALDIDFAEHLGGDGPAGIVWNSDGTEVWTTDSFGWLHGAKAGAGGSFAWADRIALPSPSGSIIFERDKNATGTDSSAPVGLAWDGGRRTLFVALSRDNAVAAVDTVTGRVLYRVPVGNAPFGILRVGKTLYVTNWAGRVAGATGSTADSSGTQVRVDPITGAASSGSVTIVSISRRRSIGELDVGLHPTAMTVSADFSRVYVANSNGDSVSVIDTTLRRVIRTIALDPAEPFGRAPTALTLSHDGATLYVAEGGANDVAAIDVKRGAVRSHIAAGWYPSALAFYGSKLYIADLKGAGSRARDFGLSLPAATIAQRGGTRGYNVYDWSGLVQRVAHPGDAAVPSEWVASGTGEAHRVLSRFKHVIYIIAENHTYDDYFGDIPAGNGDKRLCAFCGAISPNHHALAARFGLFDNFYVNSVLSADGHNWTDEAFASDYVERSLSGWGRSYPSAGNDAMAYSPQGFIWNRVLASGLTFRDYGEFFSDEVDFQPEHPSWSDFYNDYLHGTRRATWTNHIGIASLAPYVAPDYPSFSLRIPDQTRASMFLSDLRRFEREGHMPNLMLMSLPNDHTSGTDPGRPTPRAYAADNDLALGRIVTAVSESRFWPSTVIFVIEDDAQDGLDHVDGHRTMALTISAYQEPNRVYHGFYDQTSILRTIELIFSLQPMTRFDAHATAIVAPFGGRADLAPYATKPNLVPLDELNPALSPLRGVERTYALQSTRIDFDSPDREDGVQMARIIRSSLARESALRP